MKKTQTQEFLIFPHSKPKEAMYAYELAISEETCEFYNSFLKGEQAIQTLDQLWINLFSNADEKNKTDHAPIHVIRLTLQRGGEGNASVSVEGFRIQDEQTSQTFQPVTFPIRDMEDVIQKVNAYPFSRYHAIHLSMEPEQNRTGLWYCITSPDMTILKAGTPVKVLRKLDRTERYDTLSGMAYFMVEDLEKNMHVVPEHYLSKEPVNISHEKVPLTSSLKNAELVKAARESQRKENRLRKSEMECSI